MQLNITLDDELIRQAKIFIPKYNEQEILEIALRTWLNQQRILNQPENSKETCYDLAKHLIGAIQGPADLSINKKYLQGFGE